MHWVGVAQILGSPQTIIRRAITPVPIAADADVALESKNMSISAASDPPSTWHAPPGGDGSSTLPTVITVRRTGGIVRAWRADRPPAKIAAATDSERALFVGVIHTKPISVTHPSRRTTVREMLLGVEPSFLAAASKTEIAIFLAVLTEMFWARGGYGVGMPFQRSV